MATKKTSVDQRIKKRISNLDKKIKVERKKAEGRVTTNKLLSIEASKEKELASAKNLNKTKTKK